MAESIGGRWRTRVAKAASRVASSTIDLSAAAIVPGSPFTGRANPTQPGSPFRAPASGPPKAFPAIQQLPPEVEQALIDEGMQTGEPLSVGSPLRPFLPWGTVPWQYDRPVGYNIATRPRATETRASFATLKSLLGSYDVARMCIEHRQDDIRSMDWRIIPAKNLRESDIQDEIEAAEKVMGKPDGTTHFGSWQSAFLEDVLRFDAGCLYKGRNRGGDDIRLEVVDGTTIAPLLDFEGRRPSGDAPAFLQFVAGVPSTWLFDRDLVYLPFRLQTDSPYGMAPIEWMFLNANTDVRFQLHFLQYFTEGTLPEGFMEAPEGMTDPEQVQALQSVWDAVMEGDQAMKHKVRWVPNGSKWTEAKDKKFDEHFSLFLMRKTCAAYKVVPQDLGFTEEVNRSSSETQVDVQFRIGTNPLVNYLQDLYTDYLQNVRKLRVQFKFDTGQEKEDRLHEAEAWQKYVEMGAASPDEPREKVLGLPIDRGAPIPRFIMSRLGPVPLQSLIAVGGEHIDPYTAAPEPGTVDQMSLATAPATGMTVAGDTGAAQQASGGYSSGKGAVEQGAPALEPPAAEMAPEKAGDTSRALTVKSTDGGAAQTELEAFARFAQKRIAKGTWRSFDFEHLDDSTADYLNALGAAGRVGTIRAVVKAGPQAFADAVNDDRLAAS